MNKTLLFCSSIALATCLSACGGGSSSTSTTSNTPKTPDTKEPSTSAVNGRVIDGYLVGATVFLDKNQNAKLDDGEKSTKTGAGGKYTLDLTETEKNYPIYATIDSNTYDTGENETLTVAQAQAQAPTDNTIYQAVDSSGKPFILSTPPGQADITPYTTIVNGKLKDNAEFRSMRLGDPDTPDRLKRLVNKMAKDVGERLGIPEEVLLSNFLKNSNNNAVKNKAEVVTALMSKLTELYSNGNDKPAGDLEAAIFEAMDKLKEGSINDATKGSLLKTIREATSIASLNKDKGLGKYTNDFDETPAKNIPIIKPTLISKSYGLYKTGVSVLDTDSKKIEKLKFVCKDGKFLELDLCNDLELPLSRHIMRHDGTFSSNDGKLSFSGIVNKEGAIGTTINANQQPLFDIAMKFVEQDVSDKPLSSVLKRFSNAPDSQKFPSDSKLYSIETRITKDAFSIGNKLSFDLETLRTVKLADLRSAVIKKRSRKDDAYAFKFEIDRTTQSIKIFERTGKEKKSEEKLVSTSKYTERTKGGAKILSFDHPSLGHLFIAETKRGDSSAELFAGEVLQKGTTYSFRDIRFTPIGNQTAIKFMKTAYCAKKEDRQGPPDDCGSNIK